MKKDKTMQKIALIYLERVDQGFKKGKILRDLGDAFGYSPGYLKNIIPALCKEMKGKRHGIRSDR